MHRLHACILENLRSENPDFDHISYNTSPSFGSSYFTLMKNFDDIVKTTRMCFPPLSISEFCGLSHHVFLGSMQQRRPYRNAAVPSWYDLWLRRLVTNWVSKRSLPLGEDAQARPSVDGWWNVQLGPFEEYWSSDPRDPSRMPHSRPECVRESVTARWTHWAPHGSHSFFWPPKCLWRRYLRRGWIDDPPQWFIAKILGFNASLRSTQAEGSCGLSLVEMSHFA